MTWGALAFVLTVLAGGYTWWAYRHRGAAATARGAALTLLPPAAYLTGTLEMFTEIAGSITDWATHLAFSPVVWAGAILAGISVVLFGVAGRLGRSPAPTSAPISAATSAPSTPATPPSAGALGAPKGRPAPAIDDDLSEIEAILKKRGIN